MLSNVIKLRKPGNFASPKSSPKERTLTSLFHQNPLLCRGLGEAGSFVGRINCSLSLNLVTLHAKYGGQALSHISFDKLRMTAHLY
jgi:hypothetical protein